MRLDRGLWVWLPAVVCVVLAAMILVNTTYLMVHYFQPLFSGDAWETVEDYQRYLAGHYTLGDLFAQHNEHRLVLPRLIFLADFSFGRGLNIINESAIYLVQLCHALLLVRIAASVLSGPRLAAAAGVVFVLLFSYGQADNFDWGFQVQFVGVYAAATFAFWWFAHAMASEGEARLVFLFLSFLMVFASTYCMSNGFLSAFVLIALAVLARTSVKIGASVFLFSLATAATYFFKFHLVSLHSPPGYVVQHPSAFIAYVLIYLGGPVGSFGMFAATMLGAAGALLTVAAAIRTWSSREAPARIALLGIMLFVGISGIATAFGRLSFGLSQALESRYFTPVCIFWASQCIYWVSFSTWRPRIASVITGLVTALVLLGAVRSHAIMRSNALWMYRQANIQTDVLLSGAARPDLIAANYPVPEKVERLSRFLADRRLNIFALPGADARGRRVESIEARRDDKACVGADATPARSSDATSSSAIGWAWNRRDVKPVARVLLTDAENRVVGFASGGWFWFRADKARHPDVRSLDVGWRGFVGGPGTHRSAYALLDDGRLLCKLQQTRAPTSPDGGQVETARVDPASLGASIPMDRTFSGGWIEHGMPIRHSPRGIELPSGSWSEGTGRAGTVVMGPFVAPAGQFALAFITGTDASGASIEVDDAETDQVYASMRPAAMPTWGAITFSLPHDVAGRRLLVKGISTKAGQDAWLAVSMPHGVRR